jgi:hypothetical protein
MKIKTKNLIFFLSFFNFNFFKIIFHFFLTFLEKNNFTLKFHKKFVILFSWIVDLLNVHTWPVPWAHCESGSQLSLEYTQGNRD